MPGLTHGNVREEAMDRTVTNLGGWALLPGGNGEFAPCPSLLTEEELIRFLRIPDVSKAEDYHNVIAHLKRYHDLPCIHICRQPLYPLEAILDWIRERARKEMIR
ncbi:MAG: hypothetical protein ACYS76_04355 [Planctomycetota bacterium]|jgi:hypothetical protein